MVKKIYVCEESNHELQIQWSDKGIHFSITHNDGSYITELLFNEFDAHEIVEDIELYIEGIKEKKDGKSN